MQLFPNGCDRRVNGWKETFTENHDTNDVEIQFVAWLNYIPKHKKKRQRKWKPKECARIAQVRIIKVDSFGRSGLLRFTNDEEITRIPTIFMLCVKPHIRSVSSCKSSRANEEQIKQLLIIHSHTVICIKFQANTKLFE